MKIFISLATGILRSVKSWKGIMIVWLSSLLLVSLVAIPTEGAFKAGLGNSMITEKLANGINIEVFADQGTTFRSLFSYFSTGLLIVLFVGFLINSFLSGGLFDSLKEISGTFSFEKFFIASVKNFWSFIIISLIISLAVILLATLIVVIPVSIVKQAESFSEGAALKTGIILTSFFLLILVLLLLVADYARAWQVSHNKNECFKALGFGFSQTFRTLFSSYPLMLILLVVQLLFGWLVLIVLPGIRPVTEGGIVLLFILSQFLFFIKILLKVWRYGSVMKMMELNFNAPTGASNETFLPQSTVT